MKEKEQGAAIGKRKLAAIYLAVWLGSGLLAALFHILARPDYIGLQVCIVGAIANLFGPWARPLAIGWPNAGEAPDPPYALAGAIVIAIIVALVMVSMTARKRWQQIVCLVLYISSIGVWIGLGVVTLMICAI